MYIFRRQSYFPYLPFIFIVYSMQYKNNNTGANLYLFSKKSEKKNTTNPPSPNRRIPSSHNNSVKFIYENVIFCMFLAGDSGLRTTVFAILSFVLKCFLSVHFPVSFRHSAQHPPSPAPLLHPLFRYAWSIVQALSRPGGYMCA